MGQAESIRVLTSLRFFAAALIVFLHLSVSFHWHWLRYVPHAAALGVTFFFILSGFILTHVYRHRRVGYFSFLRARLARIWPLHFAVLIAMLVAYLIGILPDNSVTFSGPFPFEKWQTFLANALLLQSWAPWIAYTFSWGAVSWSVSTELFFYLLFPLLLIRLDTTWVWKLAVAVGISILWTAIVFHLVPPADGSKNAFAISRAALLYPSPIARLPEFVSGMCLYVMWERYRAKVAVQKINWTALEVVSALIAGLYIATAPSIAKYLPPGVLGHAMSAGLSVLPFVLLIGIFANERGSLSRALRHKAFVFLGEISFAMYLTHHVLIRLMGPVLSPLPSWLAALAFGLTLFVVSALCFKGIEVKARRYLRAPKKPAVGMPQQPAFAN